MKNLAKRAANPMNTSLHYILLNTTERYKRNAKRVVRDVGLVMWRAGVWCALEICIWKKLKVRAVAKRPVQLCWKLVLPVDRPRTKEAPSVEKGYVVVSELLLVQLIRKHARHPEPQTSPSRAQPENLQVHLPTSFRDVIWIRVQDLMSVVLQKASQYQVLCRKR